MKVRKLSFAVGGQSLAHRFRLHGRQAFAAEFAAQLPEAPPVRIWGVTRGGSLAASSNVFPSKLGRGARFWWDMAADAPSPEFVAGLAANAKHLRRPPACLFWDLGQFEAVTLSGRLGHDPAVAEADFRYATRRCLDYFRARLSPADPERVPILLMPHAPHRNENRPNGRGILMVRAAQQRLAREIPNCHDVGVIHGMDMEDNLHPSRRGIEQYAAHVARAFAGLISAIRDAA